MVLTKLALFLGLCQLLPVFTSILDRANTFDNHIPSVNWFQDDFRDQPDPDTFRNVSELITSKGYPVEEYDIQTPDGYILGIQRIPNGLRDRSSRRSGKGKPVVFLHHGLLSSASDWVLNFQNQSLGFILADAGYDVWLGNARGNTYSRRHTSLNPKSQAFWKFTWDEMALIDLPACFDFIFNKTGQQQLSYVGHSMGTSIIFALLSEKPEYNEKVQVAVALGPVSTVSYMTSVVRYLAPFSRDVEFLLNVFGHGEFLPSNRFVRLLSQLLCRTKARPICDNILFLMCGIESQQLNETREAVYLAHTPAGTSTYTVIHFAQMVQSKNFQKYDFGKEENMKVYGQALPPEYHVQNITTKVALMWGLNDPLADPTDVNLLAEKLRNMVLNYEVPYPAWTHLDFVYGIDANVYLYPKVLKIIQSTNA